MSDLASINIAYVIMCDDIRQEITGKFILIGVYPGNIAIPAFPAQVILGFWMLARPTKIGSYQLQFRLQGPDGAESWSGQMLVHVNKKEDTALVIPPLPIQIQSPGHISLQCREGGGEWTTVSSFEASLPPPPPPA
jgi:hypothetical protein